jgi:hypothetical protein
MTENPNTQEITTDEFIATVMARKETFTQRTGRSPNGIFLGEVEGRMLTTYAFPKSVFKQNMRDPSRQYLLGMRVFMGRSGSRIAPMFFSVGDFEADNPYFTKSGKRKA